MIEYKRSGKTWKFDALPISAATARFYSNMSKIGSGSDTQAILDNISLLPELIGRSMRDHHSVDEVNSFIDTILLDFGDPKSMEVLADINLLFMGIDPVAKKAKKSASRNSAE